MSKLTLLQLVVAVAGLVLFGRGKAALAEERRKDASAEINGQMVAAALLFALVAVSMVIEGVRMLW